MTWDELLGKLHTSLRLSRDTPEVVGVVWSVPGPTPDKQEVLFERGEVDRVPWLVMTADVCERSRLSTELALRRSAGMATGAIVLLGERFFIRHATALPRLVWEDVWRAMQVVAAEAVKLRRDSTPGAPPTAGYSD